MRTIAILPIKSFGAAKQRLASLLGGGSRRALAQAMFTDVLASLGHVPDLDGVAVVTANPVAQEAALRTGVTLLADTEEAGQSAAAQIGLRHAIEAGYERALLVPGDTPLLDPREVAAMFGRSDEDATTVTIVPDRHGEGTNALLLDLPAAIEPAFGPGSLERHRSAVLAAGAAHRVDNLASLALDVDTPEDLAELREILAVRHGQAPMTRGALRQIDHSQVGATVRQHARVEA